VSRYFPIRYEANGIVAEEQERIDLAGSKVVSGWPADEGEWPWIAALLNNDRQFCGGSLISRKHILTAAHCVAHMTRYDVANLKVRLGDWKIKQTGETEVWESKAARVVRHKEFSQQTLHKDVAIITMENEVPELPNVRPVCLAAQGGDQHVDQHATVVGWGSLSENGPQPDVLMEVTVKIWDNKVCKETYGPAAPGGIMDHMMCAGQKGKDSCSGDSGGPMQIGSGSTWTQIGVVSWGIGCGKSHYPGVYSRVSSLRDWIDKITSEY
jgi:secreted trypsin-like serine protease